MAAALPYATGDGNALRAYKQIRMLWQTELDTLYSEWIQSVPAVSYTHLDVYKRQTSVYPTSENLTQLNKDINN